MDGWKVLLFLAEATALLGSPGPGIAALVSVGRGNGVRGGLPFLGAMLLGLSLAVVLSAAGLMAAVLSSPAIVAVLAIVGTGYLLFLAVQIATAPVGAASDAGRQPSIFGGFLLGIANPKAYLAFIALMASTAIVGSGGAADIALKATLCIVVMIVVDLAWLAVGAGSRGLGLSPRGERTLNLVLGGAIVGAAILSLASLRHEILAPFLNGVHG